MKDGMSKLGQIKEMAQKILSMCDTVGDEENGTAPELDAKESSGGDTGEKSLGMTLAKYSK